MSNYWRETRIAGLVGLLILLAFVVAIRLWTYVFPVLWFDLRSVHVDDHPVGYDAMVSADRVIRRDAPLLFLVTVRDAETHAFVCSGGWRGPYNYRKAAGLINPLRMSLPKWLDVLSLEHVGCTPENGFGVGKFYISTCHQRRLLGMFPVQRCVDSNTFERVKRRE